MKAMMSCLVMRPPRPEPEICERLMPCSRAILRTSGEERASSSSSCAGVAAAGGGESEAAIAAALQVNRKTVRLWRDRFAAHGLQGLWDIAPGRGRKATYGPDRVKAVMDATLQSKPKGITPWSCRLLAENQGLSKATVSRFWRSHNLKPHRNKKFKLSRDPGFLENSPMWSAST